MRPNAIPSVLFALICLAFTACSSFTPPSTAEEDARGEWTLMQEKDSKQIVTLVRGLTPEQVRQLLRQPLRIEKQKRATTPTEKWIYRRYVLGGHSMSSALSKRGPVTAYQRVIYIETLELTFIAQQLATVKASRYREDTETTDPVTRRF